MTTADSETPKILVIDDDDSARGFVARSLNRQGFSVSATEGGREGISLLNSESFDAVLCDLQMPEVDGLDVLRYANTLERFPPFLILTAYGSVQVAVDAMKLGAVDFLEKPVSMNELQAALRSALGKDRARSKPASKSSRSRTGLVGSDSWLKPFSELLQKIASTDAIVLVEGETGTGKSAVAREIWRLSRRSRGPFIEVNCAAISKELAENELFGNIKGAFTGALGQAGKVEKASAGTLFLDEIGELSLDVQSKLLQLLQEKTYTPVGSATIRRADVRFIAATNRELEQEAMAGSFRPDLYYRLEVVKLTIPPLRERMEDLPILLEHFRRNSAEQNGRTPIFPPDTVEALARYDWPGNVRELENLVARMSVMLESGQEVRPEHLPDRIRRAAGAVSVSLGGASSIGTPPSAEALETGGTPRPPGLDAVERDGLAHAVRTYESGIIRYTLDKVDQNVSRAAKILGMKRTTLIEKKKRYIELGLL